jgi:hypothetical protein
VVAARLVTDIGFCNLLLAPMKELTEVGSFSFAEQAFYFIEEMEIQVI